jgi:acyl carrier protein
MTDAQIRERLLDLMRRELDWTGPLPAEPLSDHFTSLQLVHFATAVEDDFGIELTPEATLGLDRVDDLVAAVAAALPPLS